MNAEDDKILQRVQKLLALASPPNVHEAAQAAAQAQRLIEEHRLQGLLDAKKQEEPVEDARDEPLATARRIRKWKQVLAGSLASLNGCVTYTHKVGREEQLILVGTASDQAAVRALWDWLCHRVQWLSATHGDGHDKRWHDAFRIGAVQTIIERLQATQQELSAELSRSALVVVNSGLARRQDRVAEYAQQTLNLKKVRGIRVDAQAFDRGREAGGDVKLPD